MGKSKQKTEKVSTLPPFMFVGDAARALGIKQYRVKFLVRDGIIRAIGNGPGRRISRESLEECGLSRQLEIDWGAADDNRNA